ncbi:MAG: ABC-2 transporter permease [Lachnospiraceae bacterium]|nr:ABC-2 transporter permease [Lachnospiraceae bacterium]
MRSLLYKDYVATNGPAMIGGFGFLTLFICVFTVWCTANSDMEVILGLFTPMVFFGGCLYLLMLMSQLFQVDSGKNCHDYLLSMPVDKKEYLMSKYVYYLVANYLVLSWGIFLSMIAATTVKTEGMMMMVSTVQLMGPIVIPVMLIMAAITFPLYILYGKKKGDMIFSAFSVSIAILVFVWFLFGDISGLVNMDFETNMKWVEEHTGLIVILTTVFPIVTGVIYYLSYRITAGIFVRKERDIDE